MIDEKIDIKSLFSNENPMFEVFKKMASILTDINLELLQFDLELFKKVKEIVTKLVLVKPENRMKLEEAREKLIELDQFTTNKDGTKIDNYLLLDPFLQHEEDPTLTQTDETTQNSLRLMNEIRSTKLFTIPTTGDDKKLTQRLTNLCVSVSAMRLLSYALVEFLKEKKYVSGNGKAWEELKNKILKYPDNPESSKKTPEEREAAKMEVLEPGSSKNNPDGFNKSLNPVKREPLFIQKLLTICCGVISPRSLNGLNYCHLDDDFHIAAQQQNIRE